MSTRSFISIAQEDENQLLGIYCHFDGYPDNQLPILKKHYNTLNKVQSLLELGPISYLAPNISPDPSVPHTFNKPCDGVTVAFHRDRGGDFEPAFMININNIPCQFDYVYIFDPKNNTWSYKKN